MRVFFRSSGKPAWTDSGLVRTSVQPGSLVVVIADGADCNWRITSEQFPKSTQVLDFYHASEHFWTLARQLYRQDDQRDRVRGER